MCNMAIFLPLCNKVKGCETNHLNLMLSLEIGVRHFVASGAQRQKLRKTWLAATKRCLFEKCSYNWPLSSDPNLYTLYLRVLLYLETQINIPPTTDR